MQIVLNVSAMIAMKIFAETVTVVDVLLAMVKQKSFAL